MTVKDSLRIISAMVELEIRRVLHDQTEIYTRAIQPLLWLLIFGHVVGALKVIPTGSTPYLDYITPGIIVQSTATISIFFGLIIIWERETGILKRLVTSPAPNYAIVIGRSMAAGVRGLAQAIIIIPIAFLMGVKFFPNPSYLLLALVLLFLSCGGFAGISIMIASFFKTRERFMGIGQAVVLPMFFASSALYPISAMPEPFQIFAKINPMTYVVDAMRSLMITGNLSQLPLDIAAIAIFVVVVFTAASLTFKKVIE
ncbi:MAG: ABC transporter permease [Candidatus Diapherotrites archaeon]|nr:ABC transporter permease [Candidatus Diapherotrites archaeon]